MQVMMVATRPAEWELQTAGNTVNLIGARAAQALAILEKRLDGCDRACVLYVVHGIGTGALREAVHEMLQGDARVKWLKPEPQSAGGCTIVRVRDPSIAELRNYGGL